MKKMKLWMLAALLTIGGASVFLRFLMYLCHVIDDFCLS